LLDDTIKAKMRRRIRTGLSTAEDAGPATAGNVTGGRNAVEYNDSLAATVPLVDDDSKGDSDSRPTSLLSRVTDFLWGTNAKISSAPRIAPPDPSSPHYIAELLRYELDSTDDSSFYYLRCLDAPDRASFQAKMAELIERSDLTKEQREAVVTQSCMLLETWKEIMQRIPLTTTYKLWRGAYWGENASTKVTRFIPTNYHVFMTTLDGNPNGNVVHLLFTPSPIKGHVDGRIEGRMEGPIECSTKGHIERRPEALIFPALGEDVEVTPLIRRQLAD
jgi:hypothetical protein